VGTLTAQWTVLDKAVKNKFEEMERILGEHKRASSKEHEVDVRNRYVVRPVLML
jgi:hypothetical protein